MFAVAAWLVVPALLAHASPLTPSVPAAALDTPADYAHNTPAVVPPPEKRLLKYFLPSTQSWLDGVGQEGAKRGYGKNYLRFGRSEEDKRGAGRNFLRFGRSDISDTDLTASTEMEKRNRNFLRFGRGPNNFLRFGRSGIETGPLGYALGMEKEEDVPAEEEEGTESLPVEEKRARSLNYLRFGRGGNNRNFLRFGRRDNHNFLRFGRSVDNQLPCEDCQEETMGAKDHDITYSTSSTSPVSRAKRGVAGAEEHDEENIQRTKRSAVAAYYDYLSSPSHGPMSWARNYQPEDEDVIDNSNIEDQGSPMFKRGYNRSFLRFGRNRNFLRFGKRDGDFDDSASSTSSSDEAPEPVMLMRPVEYPRNIRGVQRNFLRFG